MGTSRSSKESKQKQKQKTAVESGTTRGDADEYVLCKRDDDGRLEVVRELLNGESRFFSKTTSEDTHIVPAKRIYAAPPGPSTQCGRFERVSDGPTHNAPINDWQLVPRSVASAQSSDAAKSDIDDEVAARQLRTKIFKISDEAKVKEFLDGRLGSLQQQANKQIAKAWIKGICPKKQARFPYQNSARKLKEDKDPEVPEWWPSIEDCPFKEPDHIGRTDRTKLCLHLLRLRPSPEKLREWGGDADRTELTAIHECDGWTAFLKAMTPKTIFDGVEPTRVLKRQRRLRTLAQMYDAAQMEERYLQGVYDADHMVNWPEENSTEPKDRLKRPRPSSREEGEKKRVKRTVELQDTPPNSRLARDMSNTVLNEPMYARAPDTPSDASVARSGNMTPQSARDPCNAHRWLSPVRSQYPEQPMSACDQAPAYSCYASVDHSVGTYINSQAPSPVMTSSSSTNLEQDIYEHRMVQEGPANFHAQQKHGFLPYAEVQSFQANQVHHIPQPSSDTVLHTPAFSPMLLGQQPFIGLEAMSQGPPLEMTIVTNGQRFQVDCNGTLVQSPTVTEGNGLHGLPYGPGGFAVPHQQFGLADVLQQATQELADYKPGYPIPHHQEACHGLPTVYTEVQRRAPREVPEHMYYEQRPDSNYPAAALPGHLIRGFTGHSSGAGGGAWT